jgi:hypothetical protein
MRQLGIIGPASGNRTSAGLMSLDVSSWIIPLDHPYGLHEIVHGSVVAALPDEQAVPR